MEPEKPMTTDSWQKNFHGYDLAYIESRAESSEYSFVRHVVRNRERLPSKDQEADVEDFILCI
jgi:hypothetical protein